MKDFVAKPYLKAFLPGDRFLLFLRHKVHVVKHLRMKQKRNILCVNKTRAIFTLIVILQYRMEGRTLGQNPHTFTGCLSR